MWVTFVATRWRLSRYSSAEPSQIVCSEPHKLLQQWTVFYMLIIQSCNKISVDSLRSLNEAALFFVWSNNGNIWKVFSFLLSCCCISCEEKCGISSSHLRVTQLHHPKDWGQVLNFHFAPFFHFILWSLWLYEYYDMFYQLWTKTPPPRGRWKSSCFLCERPVCNAPLNSSGQLKIFYDRVTPFETDISGSTSPPNLLYSASRWTLRWRDI